MASTHARTGKSRVYLIIEGVSGGLGLVGPGGWEPVAEGDIVSCRLGWVKAAGDQAQAYERLPGREVASGLDRPAIPDEPGLGQAQARPDPPPAANAATTATTSLLALLTCTGTRVISRIPKVQQLIESPYNHCIKQIN